MAADPRRVKEVFVAALDLPDPQARQAFLERECGADADLRQRLEVLLKAHDDPASALDRPLAGVGPGDAGATSSQAPANGPATASHPGPAEDVGSVSPAATSCWSRSARAAWERSGSRSRRSRSAARWR